MFFFLFSCVIQRWEAAVVLARYRIYVLVKLTGTYV
jgi:hypothetical protein